MKEEKSKKKEIKRADEGKKQRKETLFDHLPAEFKERMEEAALGENPFQLLDYLDAHKEDYKNPESPIKEEHYLLMVQEVFGSPVTLHLNVYLGRFWNTYKDQINAIFFQVECILEKLKENGRISDYRKGKHFSEDPITSLSQNMWVFLFWLYRKKGIKSKETQARKEILRASERNIMYVLNLPNDIAESIMREERSGSELDMDYSFGTFHHVSEPLIALVEEAPYEEDTLKLYEEYVKYLEKIGPNVNARAEYGSVLFDARNQLEELYENRLECLQDKIERKEEELMRLCKKRKKIYRKKGKLMERRYSWKDSWDVNLPF